MKITLKNQYKKLLFLSLIPLKLIAFDTYYVGSNGMISYTPEQETFFASWDTLKPDAKGDIRMYSLDGETFKSKNNFAAGIDLFFGKFLSERTQFEIKLGGNRSNTLKTKSTTIPLSPHGYNDILSQNVTLQDVDKLTVESNVYNKDLMGSHTLYATANIYYNTTDITDKIIPFIGVGCGFGHYKMSFSKSSFGRSATLFDAGIDPITGIIGGAPQAVESLDDILEDVSNNSVILNGEIGASINMHQSFLINIGYKIISSPGKIIFKPKKTDKTTDNNQIEHHYIRHSIIGGIKFII